MFEPSQPLCNSLCILRTKILGKPRITIWDKLLDILVLYFQNSGITTYCYFTLVTSTTTSKFALITLNLHSAGET